MKTLLLALAPSTFSLADGPLRIQEPIHADIDIRRVGTQQSHEPVELFQLIMRVVSVMRAFMKTRVLLCRTMTLVDISIRDSTSGRTALRSLASFECSDNSSGALLKLWTSAYIGLHRRITPPNDSLSVDWPLPNLDHPFVRQDNNPTGTLMD